MPEAKKLKRSIEEDDDDLLLEPTPSSFYQKHEPKQTKEEDVDILSNKLQALEIQALKDKIISLELKLNTIETMVVLKVQENEVDKKNEKEKENEADKKKEKEKKTVEEVHQEKEQVNYLTGYKIFFDDICVAATKQGKRCKRKMALYEGKPCNFCKIHFGHPPIPGIILKPIEKKPSSESTSSTNFVLNTNPDEPNVVATLSSMDFDVSDTDDEMEENNKNQEGAKEKENEKEKEKKKKVLIEKKEVVHEVGSDQEEGNNSDASYYL